MVRRAVVCLCLLLGACGPRETDTIVFALANAPEVLDPRVASDAASERTNALLFASLVVLDEAGRPQPGMADWERLNARRYRVRLLPGRAAFWDGALPVAADVVATYRSLIEPRLGSPHAGALAHITSLVAIDEVQVEFVLDRPDPLFPSRLTVGILPAAAIAATDRQLARAPLGSGAFRFVRWRNDGGLLLERRRDGQRVALVPVADPTMRALKLLRGEARLLQNDLPTEIYGYLAHRPGLDLQARAGTTFAYIGFNLADPVLARREVRAAIAHAIDRSAIIEHLFDGRAELAESVLRPGHWAGEQNLKPHSYDPRRARALLRSAGYDSERPLTLSYKTSTDPFRLRIAHVFQSQLAEVGIRLEIASYDWGTFFGDVKAGRFQLYSLAWVGVNTPDILRYAFHSASTPPAGANRGRYASAEVDGLLDRAATASPEKAAQLYRQVQRQVHQDLVYVPLWYEANLVASRGLTAYAPGHDGNYQALTRVRWADAGG